VQYLARSITQGTTKSYERSWKVWVEFIQTKFEGLMDPLLNSCLPDQKPHVIVSFMSMLYEKGMRGTKISKYVLGIKQSMILRAQPVDAFDSVIVRQAVKSGRYTNTEIKATVATLMDNHQLPFTLDMLDILESTHWTCGQNKWINHECDKKAIYLAVAIAFDTGRRISNLTHPEKGREDHCIQWSNVHLSLIPCGRILNAGPEFKQYFNRSQYSLSNVDSVRLHFTTQKQSHIQSIVSVQPIIINRLCSRSSSLVDKIIQWSLVNTNDEREEFLTRYIGGKARKLTRRDVVDAMKDVARSCNIDPTRISSHSIRRGYATDLALNDCTNGSSLIRAGWVGHSQVPTLNYAVTPNSHGGLSHIKHTHSSNITSNRNMVGVSTENVLKFPKKSPGTF
jgi:hypothetical protein